MITILNKIKELERELIEHPTSDLVRNHVFGVVGSAITSVEVSRVAIEEYNTPKATFVFHLLLVYKNGGIRLEEIKVPLSIISSEESTLEHLNRLYTRQRLTSS